MGRPRKARLDDVVRLPRPQHAVVVDHRGTLYQLIRTDSLGRGPHGPTLWVEASDFEVTGRRSRRVRRLHRKVLREAGTPEDRKCSCMCCPHVHGFEPEPDE